MFKYGDKVKINVTEWLKNANEIVLEDDCNSHYGDVEYDESMHKDDKNLIQYLFENTTFTIDMVEKKLSKYNGKIKTMITLQELEKFDIDYIFNEKELIK